MRTMILLVSFTVTLVLSRTCVAKVVSNGDSDDIYQLLLQRIENLEKRDQQQQAEIDVLRGELNIEKDRTSMLERRLVRFQMKFAERRGKDDVDPLSDKLTTTVADDADIIRQEHRQNGDREPEQIARSFRSSEEKSSRIRRHVGMSIIAFHATLTTDSLHNGVHQSIAFDHVVTNIGSAYNSHAGIFIAPVAGVYVFHTTVTINLHDAASVSIVHNNVSVASLYIRGVESSDNSGSAQAVLHLNKGDDVMVQNNNADKDFDDFSVFSGFLLYQDDASETIVG